MGNALDAKLTALAAQALAAHGLVLVQARLSGGSGRLTLQVLAETPAGASPTVEQITQASRTLSAQLDVAELINGRYILEVGSPGLDRPLTSPADYTRFTGKNAHFRFHTPQLINVLDQQLGAVNGTIVGVADGQIEITLENSTKKARFPLENVRDAHLSPTPAEIAAFMKDAAGKSKHQPNS